MYVSKSCNKKPLCFALKKAKHVHQCRSMSKCLILFSFDRQETTLEVYGHKMNTTLTSKFMLCYILVSFETHFVTCAGVHGKRARKSILMHTRGSFHASSFSPFAFICVAQNIPLSPHILGFLLNLFTKILKSLDRYKAL